MENDDNSSEFFEALELTTENKLSINREIALDGKAFLQLTAEERTSVFIQTAKVRKGKREERTFEEFMRSVAPLKKRYRFNFEREIQRAINRLNKTFGNVKTLTVNGEWIFENIREHEIERLDNVFTKAGNNYDEDRIEFAKFVTEKVKCKNVAEYTAATEYFLRVLDEEAAKMKDEMLIEGKVDKPRNVSDRRFFFQIGKLLSCSLL